MDHVGNIFRPPSEASSLLIQVTVGCSHNRCGFCAMYRDKQFRGKPFEQIEADICEAANIGPRFNRVFLCDGDALILSTSKLLRILNAIREQLPWVVRIGIYGDTRCVGKKSVAELTELRDAGLGIVYHGIESGDAEVLRRIDKGGTAAECVDTARKLWQAGITHSVIALLGVGGVELSAQHARATAALLSQMDPPYVAALTLTIVADTPIAAAQQSGEFVLPGKFGLLGELRTMVAESGFSRCRFSANHASNYLPIRGDLPRDKAALLQMLDRVIKTRDESLLKPEFLRGL